jgi:hypothetical protein
MVSLAGSLFARFSNAKYILEDYEQLMLLSLCTYRGIINFDETNYLKDAKSIR